VKEPLVAESASVIAGVETGVVGGGASPPLQAAARSIAMAEKAPKRMFLNTSTLQSKGRSRRPRRASADAGGVQIWNRESDEKSDRRCVPGDGRISFEVILEKTPLLQYALAELCRTVPR
jgi:hypothetical protein